MSDPIDKEKVGKELVDLSTTELIARASSILEIEAAYSLGAKTGRMRDALPDTGYLSNLADTAFLLVIELSYRITSGDTTIDKLKVLNVLYYDMLALKREVEAALRDTTLKAPINYSYEEGICLEHQDRTTHLLNIMSQEED